MKRLSILMILLATATCVIAAAAHHSAQPAGLSLDVMKRLAGEWVQVDEQGQPTDTVVSRVKVTAGGSAVLEIVFPGTDHEMVTVYHKDGQHLMLTHYCVKGNQPRMRALPESTEKKIVFRHTDGTNMNSEKDAHMHQGTITWESEDHILTEWLLFENGEQTYAARFNLMRRQK